MQPEVRRRREAEVATVEQLPSEPVPPRRYQDDRRGVGTDEGTLEPRFENMEIVPVPSDGYESTPRSRENEIE